MYHAYFDSSGNPVVEMQCDEIRQLAIVLFAPNPIARLHIFQRQKERQVIAALHDAPVQNRLHV